MGTQHQSRPLGNTNQLGRTPRVQQGGSLPFKRSDGWATRKAWLLFHIRPIPTRWEVSPDVLEVLVTGHLHHTLFDLDVTPKGSEICNIAQDLISKACLSNEHWARGPNIGEALQYSLKSRYLPQILQSTCWICNPHGPPLLPVVPDSSPSGSRDHSDNSSDLTAETIPPSDTQRLNQRSSSQHQTQQSYLQPQSVQHPHVQRQILQQSHPSSEQGHQSRAQIPNNTLPILKTALLAPNGHWCSRPTEDETLNSNGHPATRPPPPAFSDDSMVHSTHRKAREFARAARSPQEPASDPEPTVAEPTDPESTGILPLFLYDEINLQPGRSRLEAQTAVSGSEKPKARKPVPELPERIIREAHLDRLGRAKSTEGEYIDNAHDEEKFTERNARIWKTMHGKPATPVLTDDTSVLLQQADRIYRQRLWPHERVAPLPELDLQRKLQIIARCTRVDLLEEREAYRELRQHERKMRLRKPLREIGISEDVRKYEKLFDEWFDLYFRIVEGLGLREDNRERHHGGAEWLSNVTMKEWMDCMLKYHYQCWYSGFEEEGVQYTD